MTGINRTAEYIAQQAERARAKRLRAAWPVDPKMFHETEGYCLCKHADSGRRFITISVPEKRMWETFSALICQFRNEIVDVFMESTHDGDEPNPEPEEYALENIEMNTVQHYLAQYTELLHKDGNTAIAIDDTSHEREILWDDHKTIMVFRDDQRFRQEIDILEDLGLRSVPSMVLVNEVNHIHNSSDEYREQFYELLQSLEAEKYYSP